MSACTLLASPAHAALYDVQLSVDHDGTAGFDASDSLPGQDSGPNNGIIRTHDDFRYNLAYKSDTGESNLQISLTLPAGPHGERVARWKYVPNECVAAGSSISGDGRTLVCQVPDTSQTQNRTLQFTGTVTGEAMNGQRLDAPTVQIGADSTPGLTPAMNAAALTVSAAPFYDVALKLPSEQSDANYRDRSGPNGEAGYFHRLYLEVTASNPWGHGLKGVERLRPGDSLLMDVDLSQFPDTVQLLTWAPDNHGGYRDGCGSLGTDGNAAYVGSPGAMFSQTPGINGRPLDVGPVSNTASHVVANGGECVVLSTTRIPGAAGSQRPGTVKLAIEGLDTTLNHVPTRYGNNSTAVAAGTGWVASKVLMLWTNLSDHPHGQRVRHTAQVNGLSAVSISGQPASDQKTGNNRVSYNKTFAADGNGSKLFIPDESRPVPYGTVTDQRYSSNAVQEMATGQVVGAQVTVSNRGPLPLTELMMCDIIDRTAFDIAPHFRVLQTSPVSTIRTDQSRMHFQYGARGAGKSPYFASTDSAADAYVSNGTTGGQSEYMQASCHDPDIRWFDTPQEAEAAGGLVFVRAMIEQLEGLSMARFKLYGLALRDTWAATIDVLSPTRTQRVAGTPIGKGAVIRNRTHLHSPAQRTLDTDARAEYWDHVGVIEGQTVARVEKTVLDPQNASTVPVSSGSDITYQLAPKFSTVFPPRPTTVTVSDVLFPGLGYVADSATVGGVPMAPVIRQDTPAAGYTTLEWAFPDHSPHVGEKGNKNAALPLIRFKAHVNRSVPAGSVLRNQALISGGQGDQEADCAFNAADQVYPECAKGDHVSVTVESPPGFFVEKSTSPATIQPGESFDYRIDYLSVGNALSAPDLPEILDILPFVGDGRANAARGFSARSPASTFQPGAYRLAAVVPPAVDADARIYYTSRPHTEIHNDPSDSSNAIPGGSTRWCLASEFGQPGCPADIGETTAVRAVPGITSLPGGTAYTLGLKLVTDPVIAQPGNRFSNTAGFAPGVSGGRLGYIQSSANMNVRAPDNVSSLSGRIFTDANQNGVPDGNDGGTPNQCVSLSGTNARDQRITVSRRTAADGSYHFAQGLADTVYNTADCSGTALPVFGGLQDGTYTLSRVDATPAGKLEGTLHVGTSGGTVGTRQFTQIALGVNVNATGYHFTDMTARSSLSGRIFLDLNQNNTLDAGDAGTAQQCVRVRGTTVNGEKIELSMRTSAEGHYAFREGAANTVFASADCSGTAMPAFGGLHQGEYAISRVDPPVRGHLDGRIHAGTPAGTPGTREITKIALGASEEGMGYDFTDIAQRPTLTLRRRVNNDNGGTATLDEVTLRGDSSSTQTGEQITIAGTTATAAGITQRELPAGVYALHHDQVPGYEAPNWSCLINGQTAPLGGQQLNMLTLNWGDEAVCEVVYDDQPARLTLQKTLDLSARGGAHATVNDFVLVATRLDDAGQPGTDADDRISGRMGDAAVSARPVKAGRHLLSEELTPRQARGFNAAAWECTVQQAGQATAGNKATTTDNIIALKLGDHATCSVLNTNKAASFSYRNVTDVSNTSTSQGPGASNPSSGNGSSGDSGSGTGSRPVMPTPAIHFARAGMPETRVYLSKVNDKAEDAIDLVQGERYEFGVDSVKGYEQPTLSCRDGDGKTIPSPFTLDGQIISCDVILVRKDTKVQMTKTVVEGYPRQVDGVITDFDIDYLISVTHDNDSDRGKYDLYDMPDFDRRALEEVTLQAVKRVDEKGTETDMLNAVLERGQGTDGWALAREQDIDFGATHTWRVSFRVRVREDFDARNGSCAGPGTGLYNRAVLDARNDLADPTGRGQRERLPQGSSHAACPAVPKIASSSRLTIEKRSSTRSAEVGDLLTYRLVIRNRDRHIARAPVVIDRLPAGFRLEPGSVRMQTGPETRVSVLPASRVQLTGQRVMQIQLPDIPGEKNVSGSASPESMITLSYRVRLGVGSQEGDGTNRAHVECPTNAARTTRAQCSNEARWKVEVADGVFSEETCVAGQVFVDCNGNSVKDREELGIPGVRLYLQNGTWIVSDEQGRYSYCGLRPRTHVLKIDSRTLPRRSRMVTSSSQNTGDAHSLFVDARKGMLHRADFIEGSCSASVIEQVKARQQQGGVQSVQTGAGQPALKFDSKRGANARPRQQGTNRMQPVPASTRHGRQASDAR